MKPGTPSFASIRLLDQLRARIGYSHYSLQTAKAYVHLAKALVRWAARRFGGFRRPRAMGNRRETNHRFPYVLDPLFS